MLQGPPVINGNALGTALVMLTLATPALGLSTWLARRDSTRARFVWLGSLFYLASKAFLLLFLTPFNSLFLLYVATEALAVFSTFARLREPGLPGPGRDQPDPGSWAIRLSR